MARDENVIIFRLVPRKASFGSLETARESAHRSWTEVELRPKTVNEAHIKSLGTCYAVTGIPMSAESLFAASASTQRTRAIKVSRVGLSGLAANMFFKLLTTFL